jgi:hypothetical protein
VGPRETRRERGGEGPERGGRARGAPAASAAPQPAIFFCGGTPSPRLRCGPSARHRGAAAGPRPRRAGRGAKGHPMPAPKPGSTPGCPAWRAQRNRAWRAGGEGEEKGAGRGCGQGGCGGVRCRLCGASRCAFPSKRCSGRRPSACPSASAVRPSVRGPSRTGPSLASSCPEPDPIVPIGSQGSQQRRGRGRGWDWDWDQGRGRGRGRGACGERDRGRGREDVCLRPIHRS